MQTCAECGQVKPLTAFYRHKTNGRVKTCGVCLTERRRQWQQQRQEEEARYSAEIAAEKAAEAEQTRLIAEQMERYRLLHEERERRQEETRRQMEAWLDAAPPRACIDCGQVLPARAFELESMGRLIAGSVSPRLYKRCSACLALYRTQLQAKSPPVPCVLCGQPAAPFEWPHEYHYSLRLCCLTCRSAFDALDTGKKRFYIQSRLNRLYPAPQVIYAEADPRTNEIRYIGRTGNATRRHSDHLHDICQEPARSTAYNAETGRWQETPWYSRANWMYDLVEQGLQPVQHILAEVQPAPFILEYEQRYIWHGVQQSWPLVNKEAVLLHWTKERIQASTVDLLHAPFEVLVELGIFHEYRLEAFIRKWYGAPLRLTTADHMERGIVMSLDLPDSSGQPG